MSQCFSMKKIKRNNTPRRKRLNKKQRISIAKKWLISYNGKNIVKGYSNWFGVDLLCAIKELRIAGQLISEEYEIQVRKSLEEKNLQRKNAKEIKRHNIIENEYINDYESEFEFIAGYTSNGMPFGIRKNELNENESTNTQQKL